MPGSGERNLLVPRLRGGRPEKVIDDKRKYKREREKQYFRKMTPAGDRSMRSSLSTEIRLLVVKLAKVGITYDSFSTQVDLPEKLSKKISEWCEKIPANEIYNNKDNEYGMENDHHVTILYGIKDQVPDKVMEFLKDFGPFKIRLGLVTAFRDNDDYDVLKIDVEAPELHKIHYLLADNLKNEHSYPTYAPHMTLCYLKKGNADKYIGDDTFRDDGFDVKDVQFCLKDSSKLALPLKGKKTANQDINEMSFKDVEAKAEEFYQKFSKEEKKIWDKALKKYPKYNSDSEHTSKAVDEIMTAFHTWIESKIKPGKMFGAVYALVRSKVSAGLT